MSTAWSESNGDCEREIHFEHGHSILDSLITFVVNVTPHIGICINFEGVKNKSYQYEHHRVYGDVSVKLVMG